MAVCKEYLLSLVQPSLDAIKAQHPTFSISVWGLGTAGYTVTLTKAQATWLPDGRIRIDVGGHANTPAWWAPNVSFDVGQDLQVAFTFPAFSNGFVVSVVPVGDVSASASAGGPYGDTAESFAEAQAKTQFVQARENALAQAAPLIGQAAAKMQMLGDMLLPADSAAALEYQKVTPGPDGFVIRGRILLSPRKLPRVAFRALQDGTGCTAFDCWVPGGRVTSYVWSWWRSDYPMNVVTGGFEVEHRTYADRFVLQEPALPTIPPPPAGIGGTAVTTTAGGLFVDVLADPGPPVWGQICLLVKGEHAHPVFGTPTAVDEELVLNPALACLFGAPPIPPFALDVPIDLWPFDADPPIFTPLVHIDLNGGFTPPIGPGVNVLLPGSGEAGVHTRIVHDALRASSRKDAALLVVVPASPGDAVVNRELLSVADELRREFPGVSIVSTEARSGNGEQPWRLLDAAGRWAWRHDGQADSRTLAAALDRHLVATPRLRLQLQVPMVKVGDRAPDFAVDVRSGQRTFLRRLRGRRLAVLFAPPHPEMIEPAFAPLRHDPAAREDGLLPVVVLDRNGRVDVEAVQRVLGPETVVASDPDGAIGRQYGVRVRPALVIVDLDGRISTTQVLSSLAARR